MAASLDLPLPFDAPIQAPPGAAAAESACFHCGLPLPRDAHWSVTIDDVIRPMCCPGSEAVAKANVNNA